MLFLKKEMVNRMKHLLKQFIDIRDLFSDANHIELTEESYLRYQDILALLEERGYLHNVNADNFIMYYKDVSLYDFEMWLKDQMKERKKVKRREWIIAIVSALVGAVIGLIPTIINFLN